MSRINIAKTSIYCDDCGKEIKNPKSEPYCEIVFDGESRKVLRFHHKCVVAFYEDLGKALLEKDNLTKRGVIMSKKKIAHTCYGCEYYYRRTNEYGEPIYGEPFSYRHCNIENVRDCDYFAKGEKEGNNE